MNGAGPPQAESLLLIGRYWIAFQLVDLIVASIALRLEGERADLAALKWIVVQRFTYRILMYLVAVSVAAAALRGQFVGWGKLLRTGNVSKPGRLGIDDVGAHR